MVRLAMAQKYRRQVILALNRVSGRAETGRK